MSLQKIETNSKPDFYIGDHSELANYWIDSAKQNWGHRPVFTEGSLHVYVNGYWEEFNEDQLATSVYNKLHGKKVGTKLSPVRLNVGDVNGISSLIGKYCGNAAEFFNDEKPGIVFNNGFLDINGNLIDNSPDNKSRFYIDLNYNKNDKCPETIKLFESWFINDADKEQKIEVLREFIGASIFGQATKYNTAIILNGDGENGKSTLQRLISNIFPKRYVTAVAPTDWHDKFSVINLNDKRINVINELPKDKATIRDDKIKGIISGDPQHAGEKHKANFTFIPKCGHIFSCNKLPNVADDTHGFWRRWIVLNLSRLFNDDKKQIDIENSIDHEKSGILNWVIEGFLNLKARKKYIEPQSSIEIKNQWKIDTNSIRAFINDCCEVDANAKTPAKPIYEAYIKYAERSGYAKSNAANFGKDIKNLNITHSKTMNGAVYGLKLKPISLEHLIEKFDEPILIKEEPIIKQELPKEKIIQVLKTKFKIIPEAKTSIGVILNQIRFDTKNQNLLDQDIIDFLQTVPKTKIDNKLINFGFKEAK